MKLNDELIKKFAEEIENGLPFNYCCDLLEISTPTCMNWMKQGQADMEADIPTLQRKFYNKVKKAYATFIKNTKRKIYNGETGWQGSAWWLERTNQLFVLNNNNDDNVEPVIVSSKMRKNKQ